jgi:DNA repair exonuclease SbcCD ATPase subunit
LEGKFKQSSDDFKNERLVSENLRVSLAAANQKIKETELASKELEVTIETISKQSNAVKSQSVKLQRDKSIVESRVRELELHARQTAAKEGSSPGVRTQNRSMRPRSSSINPGLQHELSDTRALLSKKEADMRLANEKLSRIQTDLTNMENVKAAMEKRMQEELRKKEACLEEKQEEIEYLRAQQREGSGGAGEREEALLQRIDEDAAQIEMLVRHQQDAEDVREALRRTERMLQAEVARVVDAEARQADLVHEKEEALDQLEGAQGRIRQLSQVAHEDASRIQALTQHAACVERFLHRLTFLTPFKDVERATSSSPKSCRQT